MIVEDVTNVIKSKGMRSNFRVCPSVAENKSRFYHTSRDSGDMQNKFWLSFHVSGCHIRLPHPFPRLDECTTELFPCVRQTRAFQDPAVLDACNGVVSSHQKISERSMWKIDSWRHQPSFSCYLIRGYIIPYKGPFCTLPLRFLCEIQFIYTQAWSKSKALYPKYAREELKLSRSRRDDGCEWLKPM